MIRIYHRDATLLELADNELDRALSFVHERNQEWFPTITGLLMIGHESYIRQYVPSHEVLFQVLDGMNVLANPSAMHASLLQTFEKIELLFQSRWFSRRHLSRQHFDFISNAAQCPFGRVGQTNWPCSANRPRNRQNLHSYASQRPYHA